MSDQEHDLQCVPGLDGYVEQHIREPLWPSVIAWLSTGTRPSSVKPLLIKNEYTVRLMAGNSVLTGANLLS